MKPRLEKFKSHEEAEESNRLWYQSLSAQEKFDILAKMIEDYYGPEQRLDRSPEAFRIVRR